MAKIALFSIRPEYAEAILAGIKKFELRRGASKTLTPGTIAVIYASGRVKRIVGHFIIGRIYKGTPAMIWKIVTSDKKYGVTRESKKYIEGSTTAMAIEILKPTPYKHRISLSEIRMIIPGWNPPLSYTILEEGNPLLELVLKRIWAREGIRIE